MGLSVPFQHLIVLVLIPADLSSDAALPTKIVFQLLYGHKPLQKAH